MYTLSYMESIGLSFFPPIFQSVYRLFLQFGQQRAAWFIFPFFSPLPYFFIPMKFFFLFFNIRAEPDPAWSPWIKIDKNGIMGRKHSISWACRRSEEQTYGNIASGPSRFLISYSSLHSPSCRYNYVNPRRKQSYTVVVFVYSNLWKFFSISFLFFRK